MKHEKRSKPTAPNTIETFGGDYHRLESNFPAKGEVAATKTPEPKSSTQGEPSRKNSANRSHRPL